uniref:C2H2-type domain-containing protein n=1 Tax=Timema tahoe TaxID=61484 RepID=A0A7R9IKU5_9NEOP|nr:unnamed protein product [Timema tahoe]
METLLSQLSLGQKLPDDLLFNEGDQICKPLQRLGVFDIDDEELCHEIDIHNFCRIHFRVPRFTCHVPGCQIDFTSVMDYEVHYNSIHRYLCVECKKCLPSPHLLDLHVAECHDSFFQTLAERKPMHHQSRPQQQSYFLITFLHLDKYSKYEYQCYVETCESKFSNTDERRKHCIEIHNYPADFRFDRVPKSKKPKMRKSNKFTKEHESSADMDMEVAPTVDAPQRQDGTK